MRATCDSLRRLRPYLGTFVEIAVEGASPAAMEAAIEAAFAAIGTVHRLMSFHETDSDVSRLNRGAFEEAVAVHPWTFKVLEAALELHLRSNGMFDIRVAPVLQKLGLLPYHKSDPARRASLTPNRGYCGYRVMPAPGSSPGVEPGIQAPTFDVWMAGSSPAMTSRTQAFSSGFGITSRHGRIELLSSERVRFHDRATKIDLGGIAKGFAVDRAIDALLYHGMPSGLVNAGGDLAAFGPKSVPVTISAPGCRGRALCLVEVRDESLASSGSAFDPFQSLHAKASAIIDPSTGKPPSALIGASVRAPSCLLADALTKIVMIGGNASLPLLRHFGASALAVSAEGEVFVTPEWENGAALAA